MTDKPMQPPSKQPIGFWTTRAGEAVIARTRSALAEIGVSQPEWWVLHQLSLHPGGLERATLIATVGSNDTDEAIETALTSSSAKEWVVEDGDRVEATALGEETFAAAAAVQADLQTERMQGISEADFVTTIKVLQRVIRNVAGTPGTGENGRGGRGAEAARGRSLETTVHTRVSREKSSVGGGV